MWWGKKIRGQQFYDVNGTKISRDFLIGSWAWMPFLFFKRCIYYVECRVRVRVREREEGKPEEYDVKGRFFHLLVQYPNDCSICGWATLTQEPVTSSGSHMGDGNPYICNIFWWFSKYIIRKLDQKCNSQGLNQWVVSNRGDGFTCFATTLALIFFNINSCMVSYTPSVSLWGI